MTEPQEPVLPERSRDEEDAGWGDPPAEEDKDVRRFLEERPPHHDRD